MPRGRPEAVVKAGSGGETATDCDAVTTVDVTVGKAVVD